LHSVRGKVDLRRKHTEPGTSRPPLEECGLADGFHPAPGGMSVQHSAGRIGAEKKGKNRKWGSDFAA
jgi:hypothetical protein